MSTKRFLGYDSDENGKLVINRMQEPIVVRLYQEFLDVIVEWGSQQYYLYILEKGFV